MMQKNICHLDDKNYLKIKSLANIFSNYALNKQRLFVEVEYLKKLSELGVIREFTKSEQNFLTRVIDNFNQKEMDQISKIDQKINHDVKAVELYLRKKLLRTKLKDVESFVHYCLSSEDVNNLAYGLMLMEGKKLLVKRITTIIDRLTQLAINSAEHSMISLTHGQPASPTTFGKEVYVFVNRLNKELEILEGFLIEGKLNGSVGNFNAFHFVKKDFDWQSFSKDFVTDLGLQANLYTTQILPYDSWSQHFDSFKRINNIFTDLVKDFWWYSSFSYLKLKVVKEEVGSSAMPHKVNPIDLEAAEGNLGLSNSLLEFLSDKLTKSRLQRDLSDSTVRRNVGLSLAYSYFAYDSILRALSRIESNPDQMKKVLNENWQVLMEPMQNLLRLEGVKGDYELVKSMSRGKSLTRKDYLELIIKTKLPKRVKEKLLKLSPEKYLGLAPDLAMRKSDDRNTVIVGSQWGDEGKGKIVDYLTPDFEVCVRFNGGNNAGHTVVVDGEDFKLSLMPSGVLYGKTLCIAQGAVIDPAILIKEIKFFEKKFGKKLKLFVDPRVHIVMPYHKDWDAATEHWRGKDKVGSLHLGIGYTYSDRTNRFGIRFEDLVEPNRLMAGIKHNYQIKKDIITKAYGWQMSMTEDEIYKQYLEYSKFLKPYMGDVAKIVAETNKNNKGILFEGAQGSFLDLAYGTYPFAVGCPIISGAIFPSVGLPGEKVSVVGLMKAYTTRVGGGPFKTELNNKIGQGIRDRGHEYGTVSKRPRRVGWLDLPMIRYAHRLNGYSSLAMMKLDIMSGIKKIKVCTHYKLGSNLLTEFPALKKDFAAVKPVYETLPGWTEDITKIKRFQDLPENCRKYVEFIEEKLSIKIKYVSVSPEREAVILR